MGIARRGCAVHRGRQPRAAGAFTLVEVVIVIIILGIIAAIAVPRLSRGSEGSADAALKQDLAVMQQALEHYAAEHGGRYPDAANVTKQLTGYTDADGAVSPANARVVPYVFGPYLREVPAAPSGPNRGSRTLAAAAGPGVGWVYDAAKGTVALNKVDAAVPSGDISGGPVSPVMP
jgi:prepilin-type N-terminal cleavage/methylation domain-containing protein